MKPTLQLGCSQPPIGHQNFNYLGQVIKPNQKFITCSTKKERKKKNREKRIARVSEHCEKRIALLSASASHTFLQPSFLFFRCVALYFQPKILFSAQKHFFQPKTFLLQPKTFFSSAQNIFFFFFSVQPLFSSSSFLQTCCSFKFSLLFFQHLLFFFSLAPFIQGPIFSLATSHLFYLNKSLFSSNLE